MATRDLLIEIGTEELPPKALNSLSTAFEDLISDALASQNIAYKETQRFSTPRRLAVIIKQVAESQSDEKLLRIGPAISAAYDENGNATPAALGFAKSCSVELKELKTITKNGVEKLSYEALEKGKETNTLIPELIGSVLKKLPTPKRMRWGASKEEFVRPLHWILLLFGEEQLEFRAFGVSSSNFTRGHRFHNNIEIVIDEPTQYEKVLSEVGHIIPNFEKRKDVIRAQVVEQGSLANAIAVIDEELLDEVTSLVEYPIALTGEFDSEFLKVPPEALILAMKTHQKCFHMNDAEGNLLPKFITVSNIRSKDPLQVVKGNERVIRPRLADAKFFFETDKQLSLESRLEGLKNLVFQNKLGSIHDKVERVAKISKSIAKSLSISETNCERASLLSKCDLLTDMVREFADLQGIIGCHYAKHDGESEEISVAIQEHYLPRFSGDDLPTSQVGSVVAIADKLDTIVSLFGINQPPTGSKDPFGLRRSAIGILRIVVEKRLDLNIAELIDDAIFTQNKNELLPETKELVFQFFLDRFRSWYKDDGIPSSVFESVYALKPQRPLDFHLRVEAVSAFTELPESMGLAIANKRVSNLLSKYETETSLPPCNRNLLRLESEISLHSQIESKKLEMAPFLERLDYTKALLCLSSLKSAIDDFFDNVLVNDEDEKLRKNRYSLLYELRELFLMTADISFLDNN